MIVFAASVVVAAGRNIPQHCTIGALRLLQMMRVMWLSHQVVEVVAQSVVVDHVAEARVVCSVAVVVPDRHGALRDALENRANLETNRGQLK